MENYRPPTKSIPTNGASLWDRATAATFPWDLGTLTVAGVFVVLTSVIYTVGTIFMAMATVAYGLLVLGLLHRAQRRLHPKLMLAGIGIDISIVLILEVQRSAINTALSFSLAALQQAHIGCSSVALLLYFPTLYLGWKLWTSAPSFSTRLWHKRIAVTAFVFRTLGFLLMLSFVGANR